MCIQSMISKVETPPPAGGMRRDERTRLITGPELTTNNRYPCEGTGL